MVAMETMHFFIVQLSLSLRTKFFCISGIPMNNLAPMKNCPGRGARYVKLAPRVPQHFSHYKSIGIFPDAQGQLTPQSEVEPSRNSNSSEMLWLSLLFPRMKKIQSKMKLLEWPQHFPHYNSMGAICCHGNQSFDPTWPKT